MRNSVDSKDVDVGWIPVSIVGDMLKDIFSNQQGLPQKKWLQKNFFHFKFLSLLALSDRKAS